MIYEDYLINIPEVAGWDNDTTYYNALKTGFSITLDEKHWHLYYKDDTDGKEDNKTSVGIYTYNKFLGTDSFEHYYLFIEAISKLEENKLILATEFNTMVIAYPYTIIKYKGSIYTSSETIEIEQHPTPSTVYVGRNTDVNGFPSTPPIPPINVKPTMITLGGVDIDISILPELLMVLI